MNASLRGIWGASSNDVWAVGGNGVIVHWDGGQWGQVTSPTTALLWDVWGSASNDVWVAASDGVPAYGFMLRWNGASWRVVDAGQTAPLYAVWGTSATNVWAAGVSASPLHWNGTTWSRVDGGSLNASYQTLWGANASDVWGGGRSAYSHFDGGSWSYTSLGLSEPHYAYNFADVHGSGPNDVWMVGSSPSGGSGSFSHWDGASWTSDVRSVGTYLTSVWVFSPTDAWATGNYGETFHWDGASWTRGPFLNPAGGPLWASGPNDMWTVGYGSAYHRP